MLGEPLTPLRRYYSNQRVRTERVLRVNYLGTINDLPRALEKTADKTMKIIYTLRKGCKKMKQTGIFCGRVQLAYDYGRFGWTRGGGKVWHGGVDLIGVDDRTIRMPYYNGKKNWHSDAGAHCDRQEQ